MRQKIFAATFFAAASASAFAQSSVTLFGVVDMGLTHGTGSLTSKNSLTSGNINFSRLGFRGREDLGGGNVASFWLEAGLAADTGIGASVNSNNQSTGLVPAAGLVFNRRSTVSLSGNWGELRIGRDVNPNYTNVSIYDPWQHVGIGASQFIASTVAGPTLSYVRVSNSVSYFTPQSLGGFFGQGMAFFGENARNGAPTESDGTGAGARFGYDSGVYNVSFATSQTKYSTGNVTSSSIGGSYDFKIVKISAVAVRDKLEGALPDGRGWQVAAIAPVGIHEVRASYSQYANNAIGNPETRKLSAGYIYNLSKRTATYVTVATLRNYGGAASALGGSTTAPNGKSSGIDVGIRHYF